MKKIYLLLAFMAFTIVSCSKGGEEIPDPSKPDVGGGDGGGNTPTLEELIAADRAALVKIYENNDGPEWSDNEGWLSDKPLNEWMGIDVNSDGRVIALDLEELEVVGAVDVSGLSALEELDLSRNPDVNSLDISGLESLELVSCPKTAISELDVTSNHNLLELHITRTYLTSIDLSKNPKLKLLSASYLEFDELDLSHNVELETLEIAGMTIETLDLSNNTKLLAFDNWDCESEDQHIKEIILSSSAVITGDYIGCWGDENSELYTEPNHLYGYQYPKITYADYDQEEVDKGIAADKAALMKIIENPNFEMDPNNEYNWDLSLPLSEWSGIYTSILGRVIQVDLSVSGISGEVIIEDMPFVQMVGLAVNDISKVSISNMPKLTTIEMSGSKVESLTLSSLPELVSITVVSNKIESVTLSDFPKLEQLDLTHNPLTSITLDGLPSLSDLSLYDAQLSDIPQAYLPSLEHLNCNGNPLKTVTFSEENMPKLRYLGVTNGDLTELNLPGSKSLEHIDCYGNIYMTSCTIENMPQLSELNTSYSDVLATLNLNNLPALEYIDAQSCKLGDVAFSDMSSLNRIIFSKNPLTSFSLMGSPMMRKIDLSELTSAEPIASLVLSDMEHLEKLEANASTFKSVTLTSLPELHLVTFNGGKLSELTMAGLTKLSILDVTDNEDLALLDLSEFTTIEELLCVGTKIETLDLSRCTNIESLSCGHQIDGTYYLKTILLPAGTVLEDTNNILCWGGQDEKYQAPNHLNYFRYPELIFK